MATLPAKQQENIPSLAMNEGELIEVLRNSLYPGAADGSIKLVIGYCRASQLDPMQKPVHIVPIWDSKAKQKRDVVMPGIGLYRTQAARSGQYAGVTEPDFGEDVSESLGGFKITYPKWCRVTVRRLMPNGQVVDFTAKELWKENYATARNDTDEPNAMWKRRPYAQLAKCAEAQALRKAFPEFGAQPTADEMEGQEFHVEGEVSSRERKAPEMPKARAEAPRQAEKPATIDAETGEIIDPPPQRQKAQAQPQRQQAQAQQQPAAAGSDEAPAQGGMVNFLRNKAKAKDIDDAILCAEFGLETLEGVSVATVNKMIEWVRQQ